MQHADYFKNTFLPDVVNLNQSRLDKLETRVDSVYAALAGDSTIGSIITGKIPQGSWPHQLIIKPKSDGQFDADFMLEMKKVGKIPDGGGWRVHGRDSEQALKSRRKASHRPGYTYLHACVDDHSRIAYVEAHDNERAVTAVEFFERALIFYATHGITTVKSVLTDNGSAYISNLWKAALRDAQVKHRRTKRQTPKTNGKVERFNRTMKDEWLYVRAYTSEEDRRNHLVPFLNTYNHDREHTSIGNRPPISRAPTPGPRLTFEPIVLPDDRGSERSSLGGRMQPSV